MLYRNKTFLLLGAILLFIEASAQLLVPKFEAPIKIESISTDGEEIAPIPFEKGDKLFFVRTNVNGGAKDRKFGQEIWESKRIEGKWQTPVNIFDEANDRGNNGVIGSSKNGDKIYVFNSIQSRRKLARGIATTEREKENRWSPLKKIKVEGFEVGEGYYSFFINSSEDVLLISKPADDKTVNEDLFVSLKKEGKWSKIVNLGSTINTKGYEISPFLSDDKKALYFASNGHGGMGSADVFVSYRLGEGWTNWTNPLNLGPPINSSHFDAYFTIGNNREVFFSSNREGNLSNIYTTKISDSVSVKGAREAWVENQFLYNGLPADSVRLSIYNLQGDLVDSVITDAYGKFNFKKLSADEKYLIQIAEEDLADYPEGIIYEVDTKGNKVRKYILTKDGMYADVSSFNSRKNLIGTFKYKSLPLENAPLLVLDDLGNVIDTIYTDSSGRFSYQKLNSDENYSFKPMNLNDESEAYTLEIEDPENTIRGKFKFKNLPLENSAILVLDETGEVVDTIYTDETGRFNYTKLKTEENYSFQPLKLEDDESAYAYELVLPEDNLTGVFNYKGLPLVSSAIVVLDEFGVVLDTIYTDERGWFNYQKLSQDESSAYNFKPLKLDDDESAYSYLLLDPEEELVGKFKYKNLPLANSAVLVLDDLGNIVDTVYTDETGFFKYRKLDADANYSFTPINAQDNAFFDIEFDDPEIEKVKGVFTYKDLPMSEIALVVLDENGLPLDTIYTDEKGVFEYTKLSIDGDYTLKPLNENDLVLQEIAIEPKNKKENIQPQQESKKQPLVIYFDFNEVDLDKTDQKILKEILNMVDNNKERIIILTGHSDNVGSAENNVKISRMRALSAQKFLLEEGLPEQRIKIYFKGDIEPIQANTTVEGRKLNRRVNIDFE